MLVVDDNESARIVIADMLASMTFNLESAGSGVSALSMIQHAEQTSNPYEIVFLDWQMPNMSGLDIAHKIKALNLSHNPHLMIVTAFGREDIFQSAIDAGVKDVLLKPLNASILFDAAIRALNKVESNKPNTEAHILTNNTIEAIGGARVLLVEDVDLNQQVATELLHEAGLIVEVAENGEVALAKLTLHDDDYYAIVLMDIHMPVMDGYTAMHEIRKQSRFDKLPIVAMTANAMQQDRIKCLAAGMNDHIAKPIEPKDLWANLQRWVKPTQLNQKDKPSNITNEITLKIPEDIPSVDVSTGLRRVLGKKVCI